MAKKYLSLGSINQKKENDSNNRPTYCMKLDERRQITVDGKKVTGLYFNVNRPETKFDRMLAKGSITQEQYEAKVAEFAKGGKLEFVKFEIEAVIEE